MAGEYQYQSRHLYSGCSFVYIPKKEHRCFLFHIMLAWVLGDIHTLPTMPFTFWCFRGQSWNSLCSSSCPIYHDHALICKELQLSHWKVWKKVFSSLVIVINAEAWATLAWARCGLMRSTPVPKQKCPGPGSVIQFFVSPYTRVCMCACRFPWYTDSEVMPHACQGSCISPVFKKCSLLCSYRCSMYSLTEIRYCCF